jgi:hypothetical protein
MLRGDVYERVMSRTSPWQVAGDHTFPPVGRCIYCGSTSNLSDEHIVPLSLNGGWILPNASCSECATITSAFEGAVTRAAWLEARTALDFKTRHKKKRPKTVPLRVVKDGRVEVRQVAPTDNLIALALPFFAPPADYTGQRLDGAIVVWGDQRCVLTALKTSHELLQLHDVDGVHKRIELDIVAFARMLAKIAHGLAVASYGLNGLTEFYLPPVIRGLTDKVGRWVGCMGDPVRPGTPEGLTIVRFHRERLIQDGIQVAELWATIRLFAHWDSPEYTVIVGRV